MLGSDQNVVSNATVTNCEIEFLPVGDGCKGGDAIVVRYGEVYAYELMIIDGGNLDSGKLLVNHVRDQFGKNVPISHVLLTHADADHASGLREVLSDLPVRNLWLHVPWWASAGARPYFAKKNWTDETLSQAIYKEYDLIGELVKIARGKQIRILQPFAGMPIGPFRVLAPLQTVYNFLVPQFDRTPDPDESSIEATGFWIGKNRITDPFAFFFEKAVAKVQKWVEESWERERLKDGGIASASNESSVILYGDFGIGRRVLLTGDAGVQALTMAAYYAEQTRLPLRDFMFVQIPHHGSRRNVGPTILNRLLGPIQPEGIPSWFSAFVSAPQEDDTHPRKMVINAFMRRGARVIATQGSKKVFWGGFPERADYTPADPMIFSGRVEEYD